jgi:hypothetical protein
MNPLKLIVYTSAILGLLMVSTCTAVAGTEKEKQENKQQFVELLPKDFRPAFSRETVIKLNAIVRRSYDVINEYDAIIGETYSNVMKASKNDTGQQHITDTKKQLSVIQNLQSRSDSALSDMMLAVDMLKKSGEDHNEAILAGMVNFVKDVQKEIAKKNNELNTLLENT